MYITKVFFKSLGPVHSMESKYIACPYPTHAAVNGNCQNIALTDATGSWVNYNCDTHGKQGYCAHGIFKTNCCICGGGKKDATTTKPTGTKTTMLDLLFQ